jgi:endo-1,4-beta-xylanase
MKKPLVKNLLTLSLLRGQYNFNEPDKMIEWARSKGWGVRGHCLFWDVEEDSHYPDWVKPLTGQDMVDAVYGRLESAVNHYRVSLYS